MRRPAEVVLCSLGVWSSPCPELRRLILRHNWQRRLRFLCSPCHLYVPNTTNTIRTTATGTNTSKPTGVLDSLAASLEMVFISVFSGNGVGKGYTVVIPIDIAVHTLITESELVGEANGR